MMMTRQIYFWMQHVSTELIENCFEAFNWAEIAMHKHVKGVMSLTI